MSFPSTIAGLNQLPADQKRDTYAKILPPELLKIFHIEENLRDQEGRDLFKLDCPPGASDAEISL
ncbi:MAG: hypothetical protein MUP11_02090, partial [Anaerolineales bacterium]|nr:hypothetical protein [Anaerolineales bacterium]